MRTTVTVEDLRVRCLIGVRRNERLTPQVLRVDLSLELDAVEAARSDDLARTVPYDLVAAEAAFVLEAGRFRLLESAAWVLARCLLLPPHAGPAPRRATVRLTKFGVLPGEARAVVQHEVAASEVEFPREDNPWGWVDVVAETPHVGVYRLNIRPGRSIPHHVHRAMQEAELVLTEGLEGWRDEGPPRPLAIGQRLHQVCGQPHGYRNAGAGPASLLCVNIPPFQADDEIPVPGGPA